MEILAHQVTVPLGHGADGVRRALLKKLRCRHRDIGAITVWRRSLDARPRFPQPRRLPSAVSI